MSTSINGDLLLSEYKGKQNSAAGKSVLGKDDFLKILITQLQNQDPTNPMQDREFIAQMATFSSLEQMTNMNQNLQQYIGMQADSVFLQQSQMIGKKISYEIEEKKEDGSVSKTVKEDTVKSVIWENGSVKMELSDGSKIESSQIVKISEAAV